MENSILIIEDDNEIARLLAESARSLGAIPEILGDGEAALHRASERNFALLTIDIGLPGISGFEVCRRFRESNQITPILMLTSQSDEADRVLGLELGADDYVIKPFSIREVTARMRVLIRRYNQIQVSQGKTSQGKNSADEAPKEKSDSALLNFGPLIINKKSFSASLKNSIIGLSTLEFDVLLYLAERAGTAVSREELMKSVWGYECSQFDSTVTTLVSRLRSKLESDPENPRFLTTVRGVGYRFIEPSEATPVEAAKDPST